MGILDRFRKKEDKKRLATLGKAIASKQPTVPASAAKPQASPAAAPTRPAAIRVPTHAHAVLLRPYVTEKSTAGNSHGEYTFLVDTAANKVQVRRAVQEVYGVTPVSIRIVRRAGKMVRYGRTSGRRRDWKKAFVRLKAGETMQLTENT